MFSSACHSSSRSSSPKPVCLARKDETKPWAVKAVGHGVLAAHGAVVALLLLGFGFGGHGHAGDGVLQCDDGVDGAGEGELHRAADLAAVDAGGHHRAEGAHVEEVLAHPLAGLVHGVAAALAFLAGFFFAGLVGSSASFGCTDPA
jgi:hypothetical protein